MRTNAKALLALALIFGLAACSTPSRRSKVAYLKGNEPIANVDDAVGDLKRSQSLQVLEKQPEEKENPGAPTKKPIAYTVGMVEGYPLTPALADKIAETSVTDMAFKERWSEKQTKDTIAKRRAGLARLMKGQTCFALSLEGSKNNVAELKYWYGQVVQNGKEYPLNFKNEGQDTLTDFREWVKRENKFTTTDFYGRLSNNREVVACAAAKLDLTQEFKLVFEPRFERGVLKAELQWKQPGRQVVTE